jgi:hypothetical protein
MDVKTAFLNGNIEEELYMVQPKYFVDPKDANKVCKLQRSIYGLKQVSRSWNLHFDEVIKGFGIIQTYGEACMYKKVSGSSVAFLILYVDDILLIGNDTELSKSLKDYLNSKFSMKDLGEAAYILGIKIYRDRLRRFIGLSQFSKKNCMLVGLPLLLSTPRGNPHSFQRKLFKGKPFIFYCLLELCFSVATTSSSLRSFFIKCSIAMSALHSLCTSSASFIDPQWRSV